MDNIQKTIDDIFEYVQGVWLKKRNIVIFSWLICPIGWVFIANMPDVYQSSAKVYADTRSILQPLLRGLALQNNIDQELQLIARTLLSRPNLEKIARNADLDVSTTTVAEYEALIAHLKSSINFRPSGRDNIYTIDYEDPSPQIAKRVVEETLTMFVESTLGSSRQDSDTATKFLQSQITEYEKRLTEAENRLSDFRRKHSDILVESAGGVHGQVANLKLNLEEVNLKINELESRIKQAKEALNITSQSAASQVGGQSNSIETEYDERIENLEQQLDSLLIRYTGRHPDVIETQNMLTQLKKLRQDKLEGYRKRLSESNFDGTENIQGKVGEELLISMQQYKNELASLAVRKKSYSDKIDSLQQKMDLIPQIEAQMSGLNRDYDITKSKYDELLSRRESMQMSKEADLQSDDVQFRVIEPARLPLGPSGPPRVLLNVVVLIFGLAVGVFVAFVNSQVSPIVVTGSQLTRVTGFPVLGKISHVDYKKLRQQAARKLLVFWGMNALLLVGFCGFTLMAILGFRLDSEFISSLFNFILGQS